MSWSKVWEQYDKHKKRNYSWFPIQTNGKVSSEQILTIQLWNHMFLCETPPLRRKNKYPQNVLAIITSFKKKEKKKCWIPFAKVKTLIFLACKDVNQMFKWNVIPWVHICPLNYSTNPPQTFIQYTFFSSLKKAPAASQGKLTCRSKINTGVTV